MYFHRLATLDNIMYLTRLCIQISDQCVPDRSEEFCIPDKCRPASVPGFFANGRGARKDFPSHIFIFPTHVCMN